MANCTEEGCQVFVTGRCINDLDLDDCPHYSDDDEYDDGNDQDNTSVEYGEVEDSVAEDNFADDVDVYSGKALSVEQAGRISNRSLTRLVMLAGLPDAGKTTFLLSLIQLFQFNASFSEYLFAGSETLLDYEEKAHPSKIASDLAFAETIRTPVGSPKFLHLKVANKENVSQKTDLLFTDISGELFITLKNNSSDARNFLLCERADHFAIFFDSEKLTSVKDRANTRASGLGILRSLKEAGTLLPHTRIQVVFSRWDLFSDDDQLVHHEAFIQLLKDDILQQFGKFFQIDFFEVSARPKDVSLPLGYGIDSIFPVWVSHSILSFNRLDFDGFQSKTNERQFLQFK